MQRYCCHCLAPVNETDRLCPACGKPIDADSPLHHLSPGTVLKERYYIGKALGQGGFGITYGGVDTLLGRKIAVKEYYPNGFVNRYAPSSSTVLSSSEGPEKNFFEKGKQRFLMEANTLAGFAGNKGIVDVLDFFEENNTAYIVMEFIDGVPLSRYLSEHGKLSAKETLDLIMPVMRSLQQIHAQGLIHRDISPDNIMLTKDENGLSVKLIDFGAARETSPEGNRSLTVVLKPGYAPIEQYGARDPQGTWTDVYALCATIYKCITGVTPVAAPDRVRNDDLAKPSDLGTEIDPRTEAALMKGLRINANERCRTIDDFLNNQLNPSAQDQQIASAQTIALEDRPNDLQTEAVLPAEQPEKDAAAKTGQPTELLIPTRPPEKKQAAFPAERSKHTETYKKPVLRKVIAAVALTVALLLIGAGIFTVVLSKQLVRSFSSEHTTEPPASTLPAAQETAAQAPVTQAPTTVAVATTAAPVPEFDPRVDFINFETDEGIMKFVRVEKANDGLTDRSNAYVFIFEYTNKLSKPAREWNSFTLQFYQHGAALNEVGNYTSLGGDQFDIVYASSNEVLPGGTLTFGLIAAAVDSSPVTILVRRSDNLADTPYQMMEVNLSDASAGSSSSVSYDPSASSGERNALQKARDYLSFTAFSYSGLVKQLEYEGYSVAEATYAADNCGADWYEQAEKKAQEYLDFSSFSRSGLISQLEYEGFTSDQAARAVDAVY